MAIQVGREAIAVVGAGVIGCAVAWALTREGHKVVLIDRDEPGRGGASFGNVGHIAAELVEPLPSPQLLLGFWKELFAFGGPLSIPLRRLPRFAPWAWRFAAAAFRRDAHTQYLALLVKPASHAFETLLKEIGRPDLLKRHGHYQFWLGPQGDKRARVEANHMERLGIPTAAVARDVLSAVGAAAQVPAVAGLWFPQSAHVLDPFEVCTALAQAAVQRGAAIQKAEVQAMAPRGDRIELLTEDGSFTVATAVVCLGAWSAPFLRQFGLRVPMEAARGYHIELPGQSALVDAPAVYMDQKVLVTPMAGRLRASSYMEFAGLKAPPDPRKPAQLRAHLKQLGYVCEETSVSWMGPRPVLPDYLPGIGRAPGPGRLFYAIGHQHIGLTLAPVTAELMVDCVAGRMPRQCIAPFDLRRFS